MSTAPRSVPGAERNTGEAELGCAETDHVIVLREPLPRPLGRGAAALRITGTREQRRLAPEREAAAAAVAVLLPDGEAAVDQVCSALEVTADAGDVAERVQRVGIPLGVGELPEAG